MEVKYKLSPVYHIGPIYITCDKCTREQPVTIKVISLNCKEGRLRTFCVYCKATMNYRLKKDMEN